MADLVCDLCCETYTRERKYGYSVTQKLRKNVSVSRQVCAACNDKIEDGEIRKWYKGGGRRKRNKI